MKSHFAVRTGNHNLVRSHNLRQARDEDWRGDRRSNKVAPRIANLLECAGRAKLRRRFEFQCAMALWNWRMGCSPVLASFGHGLNSVTTNQSTVDASLLPAQSKLVCLPAQRLWFVIHTRRPKLLVHDQKC